ncbi:hypothetical protein [Larkinella rosea]|uniref:Lipocalin-like domain-containing protein n=1 Tax=Larkinella rosea TaxID=2025312 RepID=A0A3P1BTR2_9BACT|nr:hypothetical protein [Larkinella rosea]RRB04447.1 hypothetical protein EHT25_13195 [Larkinella rosea]
MKKILPLLTLLLITWGCQPNEPKHPIVGDWRWVSSTGGIATLHLKPRDNDVRILRFKEDGIFEVYSNQALLYSGNYQLINAKSIYNADKEPGISVSNFVSQKKDTINFYPLYLMNGNNSIIRKVSTRELELADNCDDCFRHTFTRD